MTEVGVPTPEEEVLGRRVFDELLNDPLGQAALWIPIYEIVDRLGVGEAFTDGAMQAFCAELYTGASSRPPSGYARYMPPPGPPPA